MNQLTSVGGLATAHDARGNLTTDPTSGKTYGYTSENLLTSATGSVTAAYDPMTRLYQVAGAATTRFGYDGGNALAEYDGAGALQRRFVFDDGGQPVVQYEGTGTASPRYLGEDERGTIISLTDNAGAVVGLNRYDEYGKPQSTNVGRFQYTGQKWIGELGLYDYKARMYAAQLGRFVQPDPIGYEDSPNLYNYVLGDPVNNVDPLGLAGCGPEAWVCGKRLPMPCIGSNCVGGVTAPSNPGGPGRPGGPGGPRGPGGPGQPGKKGQPQEKKLTPCQKAFLESQLSSRGLPTSQLSGVTFVSGLGANANAFTANAFNGGAIAVTQGNTIYVQPTRFNEVANFQSSIGFEEVYHTSQFAMTEGAGFYGEYGLLSVGGLLSGLGSYAGNMDEAFAKGAAKVMFEASQSNTCPR